MNLDSLYNYALLMSGTRYAWGGKTPEGGLDCSGFVGELLKAGGVLKDSETLNAQGIYYRLTMNGAPVEKGELGACVFYGRGTSQITHVAFCLDDELAVGADGGGPGIFTPAQAEAAGAFVKIRPVKSPCYREDVVAIIRPNYP